MKVIDISTFQKLKPGFNLVAANHALVLPMSELQSERIEATPLCEESLDLVTATLPMWQS